jgi:hypothetical protein
MAKAAQKRSAKTVLKLPDLEQSKTAVLNSISSPSSRRSYDHAIRTSSTGTAQNHVQRSTEPS